MGAALRQRRLCDRYRLFGPILHALDILMPRIATCSLHGAKRNAGTSAAGKPGFRCAASGLRLLSPGPRLRTHKQNSRG
jgi:hypothetical protein